MENPGSSSVNSSFCGHIAWSWCQLIVKLDLLLRHIPGATRSRGTTAFVQVIGHKDVLKTCLHLSNFPQHAEIPREVTDQII